MVLVAVLTWSSRAGAATPVRVGQLHLDRPSGTHTVGVESFAGCSGSSAPGLTDRAAVAVSADANGNAIITIVVSRGTFSGPVVELEDGRLELTVRNSGTSSWTLDGIGTAFTGTGVTRTGTCTVSAPETLTLDGAGLTLVGQAATPSTIAATTTPPATGAPTTAQPSPSTTSLAASPVTTALAAPRTASKSSSATGLIVGAIIVVAA